MKKNISIIFSLVLLFSSINVFGQGKNMADPLIKKMIKNLRDPKNVEISFTYSYKFNDASKNTEEQEGTAYIEGEKYKILMKEQENISNALLVWTYLIEDEEVMISNASDGTENTPFKLITTLDRDFTAKLTGIDEDKNYHIDLQKPKGQFHRVSIILDNKCNIKYAEITAEDSSKLILDIKEIKTNQTYKDDFFTFDESAHHEVEIIDMR